MEIPEGVAILPLEEKRRYIIELRKEGKTYREIAKILKVSPVDISRVLRGVVKKDEITELKEKVEEISEIMDFYDLAKLIGKRNQTICGFCKGEYCKLWRLQPGSIKWEIREEKVKGEKVYRLNVKKHVEFCALCYMPILKEVLKEIKKRSEDWW